MSDAAIKVESVFKKYSKNAQEHLTYGLGDLLREITGSKVRDLRRDEFYAVNNVSFELSPGDSFALIGRNGSGKTTMLKMLNGLIKPDGGRITLRGRVQALINLGAGFSPRLSGRENIFNSASLMGLKRAETEDLLESIIDFSELHDFIDSPVGTYSSGMNARLGFSVAVHLKPDILLIDEILAVGDFAFQNKCYARMEQLKRDGVTIVLVSHSHGKVIQLCERAIWMHEGRPMFNGPAQDSVKEYLKYLEELEQEKLVSKNIVPVSKEELPPEKKDGSAPEKAEKDPSVRLAISEPKTTEDEIQLSPTVKKFKLSGWYTAPESKLIEVTLNDEVLELQSGSRPDVEAQYPDAENVSGFNVFIERRELRPVNTIIVKIGGVEYWSKRILVNDGDVAMQSLANSGLYGPVFKTNGLIDNVKCEILIDGKPEHVVPVNSNITIRYAYTLLKPVAKLHMTLILYRKDGTMITAIPSLENELHRHIKQGTVRGEIEIADLNLVPGTYVIMMPVCDGKQYLTRNAECEFYISGDGELFWGVNNFNYTHRVSGEGHEEKTYRATS